MVFFASKGRVKGLPLRKKVWMYPTAYVLKAVVGVVVTIVDKFDDKVIFDILSNKDREEF